MKHNRDTNRARQYHDFTRHSYSSIHADRHYLDWANQPSPFKIYPDVEPTPLPRSLVQTLAPALEVVASTGTAFASDKTMDLARVASILYYSAGVTRHKTYPGGELYFRAAACAGALYPTEVYIVCGDLDGLAAGVYHFSPGDFALRKLREGDFRGVLLRASAGEGQIRSAPVTLVFTSISWRSSWKYRDRAYRYHFWDNGMILANALAMAQAHELHSEVVMGFVEADVNRLIGIDGQQELALSLLALGDSTEALPDWPPIEELPEINFDVIPISQSPVDYASIREMHEASSLTDTGEVVEWRDARLDSVTLSADGVTTPLVLVAGQNLPGDTVEDVIQRRGSTRRFARKPMPFADLSTIIDRASRGVPADFLPREASRINDIYAIVNRVDGLSPGAYFYRVEDRAFEVLKRGDFSEKAAYLTLGQDLGGDACVTFFFMADLNRLLEGYGNRGYRAAQMEAGIVGGKMYLAAYAVKRGATGLTFFDDDVTEFFSPHAAGKSCILAVSVGVPGKRVIY
jgi:SagB-type dehydrogenase family enzyme